MSEKKKEKNTRDSSLITPGSTHWNEYPHLRKKAEGKPKLLNDVPDEITGADLRKQAEAALKRANEELEVRVNERTDELRALNKKLESELTERRIAEERYRRITTAITDYIYTVRIEAGRAVETKHSEACFAVTGYTREDFAADPHLWVRMIPEGESALVRSQVDQVLSGHFPESIEHRIVRKDGVMQWVESSLVPYCDANRNLISYDGIVRDITERKNLEAQLVHVQKIETIGILAGGVAHDFNNILTVMSSIVSILSEKMSKGDPLKTYVYEMQSSVQDAANLTKDLLAFSRKDKLLPEPSDLNKLIKKLDNFLARIIGDDIDLIIIPSKESLPVMMDRSRMEQVMMNIIANARDAMPGGGVLTVSTKAVESDNEFIRFHGFGEHGTYAVITVSDTGTGMDESVRQKIFEPFFSTKGIGEGTGLGMSISYGIIKQHKGHITVESERGKGSTIRIYLPLIVRPPAEVKDAVVPDSALTARGMEIVLLAEDSAKIREHMTSYLTDLGYTIITAQNGEDAVGKFMENKDRIDIIVSDVIMPKKNGRQVYQEIKGIKPDARVLFISGYSAEIKHLQDITGSGIEIIPKPVSLEKLAEKIRNTLDTVS